MKCREAGRLLQQRMDEPLAEEREALLQQHLAQCEACAAQERELRLLTQGLEALEPVEVGEAAWQRAVRAAATTPNATVSSPARPWRLAAVCACVAMAVILGGVWLLGRTAAKPEPPHLAATSPPPPPPSAVQSPAEQVRQSGSARDDGAAQRAPLTAKHRAAAPSSRPRSRRAPRKAEPEPPFTPVAWPGPERVQPREAPPAPEEPAAEVAVLPSDQASLSMMLLATAPPPPQPAEAPRPPPSPEEVRELACNPLDPPDDPVIRLMMGVEQP